MNLTVQLLQVIPSPFTKSAGVPSFNRKLSELYRYSVKNRIPLLYLEVLRENHNIGVLESVYAKENAVYLKTLDAIARVFRLLADKSIEHAIFKTIRPYKSTTVDIDMLIFGSKSSYIKSAKVMRKAGYVLLLQGPRSTTLWDQEANIGIDLYEQVAVSFITYMDKKMLDQHIFSVKLPNGEYIKTLKPEADLACIIAHSIMKEQMYTLSEYYTFIYYLKQMDIDNFIQIIKQNSLTYAAKTHSTITALLHKIAHKSIPKGLQQILNHLGRENLETTMLIQNNLRTPHKYHPLTVARSFLEIMKWKKCRNSVATQLLHLVNPSFTKGFLMELVKHVARDTY